MRKNVFNAKPALHLYNHFSIDGYSSFQRKIRFHTKQNEFDRYLIDILELSNRDNKVLKKSTYE